LRGGLEPPDDSQRLKKAAAEIDKRFVEYLLELSDGVTGRILDVLRQAAFQGIADQSAQRHIFCPLILRSVTRSAVAATFP
jgi:hypothetical protein